MIPNFIELFNRIRNAGFEPLEPEELIRIMKNTIDSKIRRGPKKLKYAPNYLKMTVYVRDQDVADLYDDIFNDKQTKLDIENHLKEKGYATIGPLTTEITVEAKPDNKEKFYNIEVFFQKGDLDNFSGSKAPIEIEDDDGTVARPSSAAQEPDLELLDEDGTVARPSIPGIRHYGYLEISRGMEEAVTEKRKQISSEIFNIGRNGVVLDKAGNVIRNNHYSFRQKGQHPVTESVSRPHAQIIYINGKYQLLDTGSKNGTFILRKDVRIPVEKNTSQANAKELIDGDIIGLGDALLIFQQN